MNLDAICKQYNISKDMQNLFREEGIMEEDWEDMDEKAEKMVSKRLETSVCLSSLGLDVKTIKNYILLEESKIDTRKERIKILRQFRDKSLNDIHETKKTLDCINCVLDELQVKK